VRHRPIAAASFSEFLPMKRFILSLAAASALMAAAPGVASAQAWQSVNDRQAQIDRRIDQGVRSGELTRAEAVRLRGQFREIAQLERHFRRTDGRFTAQERREIDRRLDRLSQRVYAQKHDRQDHDHRRF